MFPVWTDTERRAMRGSLFCLLLTGCSAFGLGAEVPTPQMTASSGATENALLLPDGLLAELGTGASVAIERAQADALQSDTPGTPVMWTYEDLSGRIVPGPKYMVNTRICRDLVYIAEKDRHRISGRATLCISRDGHWERVG